MSSTRFRNFLMWSWAFALVVVLREVVLGLERVHVDIADEEALPSFFSFERTNFGIIHIRTDSERVLVFTHSGKEDVREDYRFTVDEGHNVEFAKEVVTG